jgi:hypothetical protein
LTKLGDLFRRETGIGYSSRIPRNVRWLHHAGNDGVNGGAAENRVQNDVGQNGIINAAELLAENRIQHGIADDSPQNFPGSADAEATPVRVVGQDSKVHSEAVSRPSLDEFRAGAVEKIAAKLEYADDVGRSLQD